MTSVKEFRIAEPATATRLGRGAFAFTDDYSVFDWGKMPDEIPRKGRTLCAMGAANFERLEAEDIPTHYRGVVPDDSDEPIPLADAAEPPREMAIELTQVPALPHEGREYDYDTFHAAAETNYLIPLEIVFRNTIPVGSSLRSRGEPGAYGLDTETWPDESVELPDAVVEFSTKYEESDRYLTREEADTIAGEADIETLEAVAREVNDLLTETAARAGLVHEDGKIECCYVDGEILVADVVGTLDENRFSYDGQQLSKEVVRQYHKREQSEWVDAVGEAKRAAADRDVADWRELCDRAPAPLPEHVIETASEMYRAGANAYLDRDLFDAPALPDAVDAVRDL
ncbi:phosphoribosylaminoimidazolesuccinocarboxamide synthase [Halobacteriales archaeon SW_6_65_46]|nr:MAG: phosphoribosylaminoimidazolesuccinocarboxamide synthase [Halobacteriales archaeon SW_6_65_46]